MLGLIVYLLFVAGIFAAGYVTGWLVHAKWKEEADKSCPYALTCDLPPGHGGPHISWPKCGAGQSPASPTVTGPSPKDSAPDGLVLPKPVAMPQPPRVGTTTVYPTPGKRGGIRISD